MTIFDDYGKIYDVLYRDKNYEVESMWVARQIHALRPHAKSFAEFGCGSGGHAFCLSRSGFRVAGIDQSPEMIRQANEKKAGENINPGILPEFHVGDVRSIRLGTTFDAVVSLFHVMSYMTSDDDLNETFRTAWEHLAPNGIFLFDCWYGPGVLCDLPSVRIKRFENEDVRVVRLSEPTLHPGKNIVDVAFEVFVTDKKTMQTRSIRETHRMRYLFQTEVENLFNSHGFALRKNLEWLTDNEAETPWYSCFIGEKIT